MNAMYDLPRAGALELTASRPRASSRTAALLRFFRSEFVLLAFRLGATGPGQPGRIDGHHYFIITRCTTLDTARTGRSALECLIFGAERGWLFLLFFFCCIL